MSVHVCVYVCMYVCMYDRVYILCVCVCVCVCVFSRNQVFTIHVHRNYNGTLVNIHVNTVL